MTTSREPCSRFWSTVIMAWTIAIFIFAFVLLIVYMLGRPGLTPACGAMMLSPEEFVRLIAKEEQSLVFVLATGFGGNCYLTTIKGNKICTSGNRLDLPEHCELVKLQRF